MTWGGHSEFKLFSSLPLFLLPWACFSSLCMYSGSVYLEWVRVLNTSLYYEGAQPLLNPDYVKTVSSLPLLSELWQSKALPKGSPNQDVYTLGFEGRRWEPRTQMSANSFSDSFPAQGRRTHPGNFAALFHWCAGDKVNSGLSAGGTPSHCLPGPSKKLAFNRYSANA